MSVKESEQQIIDWLEAEGWREWKVGHLDSYDRVWYKQFPGAPTCACNHPKPLSLEVQWFDHRKHDAGIGIQVVLRGQPTEVSDVWLYFVSYGLRSVEDIPLICNQLLAAWTAAVPTDRVLRDDDE